MNSPISKCVLYCLHITCIWVWLCAMVQW